MSRKGWVMFVVHELVMVAFVAVMFFFMGLYAEDVAMYRKVLATVAMPAALGPLNWWACKNTYRRGRR